MANQDQDYLRTFKQLQLFDPIRFLERIRTISGSPGFSLELATGETDLTEKHWIGDREIKTRANYSLNYREQQVGNALFETGLLGRDTEKEEEPPYFESLVLLTKNPLLFKMNQRLPVSTLKILLSPVNYTGGAPISSTRVDRTRRKSFGWHRDYTIIEMFPTSDFVRAEYVGPDKLVEEFNGRKPVA